MDQQPPLGLAVLTALFGAAVLAHAVWCWSGRSRAWARRAWSDQWVLGWAPGFGSLLLGFGVIWLLGEPVGLAIGSVLVVVGFALLVPGLIYIFFEPRWWGPRWFRRMSARERRPDLSDPLTALMVGASARPRFSSERQAVKAAAPYGKRTARRRAHHVYDPDTHERAHGMAWRGTTAGTLTLYRGGLTFAGNRWEDSLRGEPAVIALAGADIAGARTVPARAGADGVPRRGVLWRSLLPRLVVETADGTEYLFEVTHARRAAAQVAAIAQERVASE